MPTFTVTNQEIQIIIAALDMPQGVPKPLRPTAATLQERLKYQMNYRPSAQPMVPIKSAWPSNPTVKPTKKVGFFEPISKKTDRKAKLSNAKTALTVDSILKGLM